MKLLVENLKAKEGFELNMIIGLDGFIDEINHVVDKREDTVNFTRIRTISDFGERIQRATGLSTNIELVPMQTKLGGNGPILSNALLEYGVSLVYVGALGKPDIHPIFRSITERAKKVYSLCNSGLTDACEFEDGKIMLGKHDFLQEVTWDAMKLAMGDADGIATYINCTHLLGMENWTMLPNMSEIWEGMIREVFPLIKLRDEKPLAFFDLSDPEKRTKEDIVRALKLISQFEQKFRVILGLNEKEAHEIAWVLGITVDKYPVSEEKLKQTVLQISQSLSIHCLVVHHSRMACCAINGEYFTIDTPYCKKPKLTTGAGDNFNAGFCLGNALELDPLSSLTLGVSTAGYYVRNSKSPTYNQVIEFIEKWDSLQFENP